MSSARNRTRLRQHVRQLHAAKRQLAASRRALARLTTPDDAGTFIDSAWRWAQELVDKRAADWERIPGVVGVGLGTKVIRGADTLSPCVTVFVRRKQSPHALARRGARKLPRTVRHGRQVLPVDVVQVGALKRQAFTGQSCSIRTDATRSGTIGAPAVDIASGAAVFLTAMHVTGRSELQPGATTLPVSVPSVRDVPGAPVIGHVVHGTRQGIDAAKVLVRSGHSVLRDIPGIGRIRGWRPLTFPGDQGVPVMMFGAKTRVRQDGIIVHPAVFMGGFGLDSAIVVRGMTTTDGDSGAALLDAQRFVLGFLVGTTSNGLQIFCPAGLVLKRLNCDIPTNLA